MPFFLTNENVEVIIDENPDDLSLSDFMPDVSNGYMATAGVKLNENSPKADELKIIDQINPTLEKLGIVMYGVDTLMGDDEKRILSEINTTSIGGIIQMEKQQGKALTKATTDQIWNFIRFKIIKKNAISS